MTLGFLWNNLLDPAESNPVCRPSSKVARSPFRVVFANDFDQDALNTYRANFDQTCKHSLAGSIESILDGDKPIPKTDVLIGGPPCQGFSLLNRDRTGDHRRSLWWHFMEVADRARAKVIVMENVPQLLGSREFSQMMRRLRELKFNHVMAHVLSAANYGVPQVRKRAIIVASRVGPIALPIPSHLEAGRLAKLNGDAGLWGRVPRPWVDVETAIADLPDPVGTEIGVGVSATAELHFGRQPTATSLERYRVVPYGGNRFDLLREAEHLTPECWKRKKSGGTDLFGRLWWARPSVTIRTEFFKPEKGRYLHPEAHRPITHREAARLQSFPDRFRFTGSKTQVARQIGNAVPPLLAYAIAKRVGECLSGRTSEDEMFRVRSAFRALLGEKVDALLVG